MDQPLRTNIPATGPVTPVEPVGGATPVPAPAPTVPVYQPSIYVPSQPTAYTQTTTGQATGLGQVADNVFGAIGKIFQSIFDFFKKLFGGANTPAAVPGALPAAPTVPVVTPQPTVPGVVPAANASGLTAQELQLAQAQGILPTRQNFDAFMKEAQAVEATQALGPGSTNATAVRELQTLLAQWGFQVQVTGTWDQATTNAMLAYKQQNGLVAPYQMANGTPGYHPFVDEATKQSMIRRLQSQPVNPAAVPATNVPTTVAPAPYAPASVPTTNMPTVPTVPAANVPMAPATNVPAVPAVAPTPVTPAVTPVPTTPATNMPNVPAVAPTPVTPAVAPVPTAPTTNVPNVPAVAPSPVTPAVAPVPTAPTTNVPAVPAVAPTPVTPAVAPVPTVPSANIPAVTPTLATPAVTPVPTVPTIPTPPALPTSSVTNVPTPVPPPAPAPPPPPPAPAPPPPPAPAPPPAPPAPTPITPAAPATPTTPATNTTTLSADEQRLADAQNILATRANFDQFMNEARKLETTNALGPGSTSTQAVGELQTLLRQWGYNVTPSGSWDQATTDAMLAFKKANNLVAPYQMKDGSAGVHPFIDDATKAAMIAKLQGTQPAAVTPAVVTPPATPTIQSVPAANTALTAQEQQLAQTQNLLATKANVDLFVREVTAAQSVAGTLGPGVSNPTQVTELQQVLTRFGFAVPVTGQFDQATVTAVLNFKRANNLFASYQLADGSRGIHPYIDAVTKQVMVQKLGGR